MGRGFRQESDFDCLEAVTVGYSLHIGFGKLLFEFGSLFVHLLAYECACACPYCGTYRGTDCGTLAAAYECTDTCAESATAAATDKGAFAVLVIELHPVRSMPTANTAQHRVLIDFIRIISLS